MTGQEEAIARVARVILQTSIKEDASVVTLDAGEQTVTIKYRIADARHERMSIPPSVWAPLREELARRAGLKLINAMGEAGVIPVRWEGQTYAFKALLGPEHISLERIAMK
jgi:type II secretory ATPase GspE/PulE/Tfp pilus assembly ATPase PilB-like protein